MDIYKVLNFRQIREIRCEKVYKILVEWKNNIKGINNNRRSDLRSKLK